MDKESSNNRDYHLHLISIYIFNSFYYSMSLQTRVWYDLGYMHISINTYNKELDKLTDEELEEKLHSLKAPWWEDMYNEVSKDRKLLEILYNRDCKLEDLKTIYEAQQKNDIKTIDYMYRHPSRHFVLEGILSFMGKIFSVPFLKSLIFILLTVSFFICLIVCAFKSI